MRGLLHVTGEEICDESKFDPDICMKMYASKLDKKDFFGKVTVQLKCTKLKYKTSKDMINWRIFC